MNAHYELWRCDDGCEMFDVPRAFRDIIHEPGARLLLRFDAASFDDAKAIKDRFLYEGNPDGLVPLDIPAAEFFFSKYRCGVSASEIVALIMDYHCAGDGNYYGHFEFGTSFTILPGDIEGRQLVRMRVQHSPSGSAPTGQFHGVADDEHFFTYFQRVNESAV